MFKVALAPSGPVDPIVQANFDLLNRDGRGGTGGLGWRQMLVWLIDLGVDADETLARQVLARYDSNCSGKLEVDEFAVLMSDAIYGDLFSSLPSIGPDGPTVVVDGFHKFDKFHSGTIDASDLEEVLKTIGIEADPGRLSLVLEEYESENGGTLDLREFQQLIRDLLCQ